MWQDDMLLMSRLVRDAKRMLRAASSGDELDVHSAGWNRCDGLLVLLPVPFTALGRSVLVCLSKQSLCEPNIPAGKPSMPR